MMRFIDGKLVENDGVDDGLSSASCSHGSNDPFLCGICSKNSQKELEESMKRMGQAALAAMRRANHEMGNR